MPKTREYLDIYKLLPKFYFLFYNSVFIILLFEFSHKKYLKYVNILTFIIKKRSI